MSTIDAELTTDDEESLAEQMRRLDSATDGDICYGQIVDPPRSSRTNEFIKLTVETPISSFTETFKKPKPPIEDYDIQRVADKYGQGLVDLDALDGERVPCQYNNGDWTIVVPRSRRERVEKWLSSDSNGENTAFFLKLIGGLLIAPLGWYYLTITEENEILTAFILGMLYTLLWGGVIAALFF